MGHKNFFLSLFILLALPPGPWGRLSAQDRRPPRPGDFAGALSLDGSPGGLLGLEIPEAVYQGLHRPDGGDIRVFDQAGQQVPFVIRRVPALAVDAPPEDLPFFPWEEETGKALPRSTDIVINAEGTVLDIKSRGPRSPSPPVYLVDLSGLRRRPAALYVSLGQEGETYNTTVRLYTGADLNHWREAGPPRTLARFGGGGSETLELPPETIRYLLLKFDKPDRRPRKISALFERLEIPPPVREKTIAGEWRGTDRRIVDYFFGGFYPLRELHFTLPQADSLEVRVKNRLYAQDDWSPAARTTLFRINRGAGAEALQNGPLEIKSAAPYWELEAAGELAFAAPPDCTIRWEPRELVFLGRGGGPWTLAWGSGDYGPPESGGLQLPEGEPGPEIEAARPLGEARYRPAAPAARAPQNWGPIVLWGVLIFAALSLSGLAFYIAQSMKKDQP
jgi:hypothetical protein